MFEETTRPRLRCMRVWHQERKEKIREFLEDSDSKQIGVPELGETLTLREKTFRFDAALKMWHTGDARISIFILPDCEMRDAETWLKSFDTALKKNPVLQKTLDPIFILGGISEDPECLAQADPDTGIVEFFNHPTSFRLFATLVAKATEGSLSPVCTERMIHHECAHLIENKMLGEIQDLSYDIRHNQPEEAMRAMAAQINPEYLIDLIETWAEKKCDPHICEALAYDFLVEAYTELAVEKKPWKRDLWAALNAIKRNLTALDVRFQFFGEPCKRIAEHNQRGNRRLRITRAPKSLYISDPP